MALSDLKEALPKYIEDVLDTSSNTTQKEHDLNKIHDQLSHISSTSLINNSATETSGQGICIAPKTAARCIKSAPRTLAYWRALKATLARQQHKKTIHIIYPGCGPFASLVLPLLAGHLNAQVKITFIDYHQAALNHLEQLIDYLGKDHMVADMICAEASTWQPSKNFDVLILECMLNGLQREGHVALVNHFAPFLVEDGQLLPGQIDIHANWIDASGELEYVQQQCFSKQKLNGTEITKFRRAIGTVFKLDRHTYLKAGHQKKTIRANSLNILERPDASYHFALCTRLLFIDNIRLHEYEDGITHPYYPALASQPAGGDILDVAYQTGAQPGFIFNRRQQCDM